MNAYNVPNELPKKAFHCIIEYYWYSVQTPKNTASGWACTYYEGHGHCHGSFGAQAVVSDVDAGGLRQLPQDLGGGNHVQFLADFLVRSSPRVIVRNVGSCRKRILAIYLICTCIWIQVATHLYIPISNNCIFGNLSISLNFFFVFTIDILLNKKLKAE